MDLDRKRLLVNRIVLAVVFSFILTFSSVTTAAIIQSGNLNFVSDVGNPSDGLGFLDLSFSVGLNQADALANAQLTYSDARVATPAEFDDLFLAAGVIYSSAATASDAFEAGGIEFFIAPGDSGVSVLVQALGSTTTSGDIRLWTDPDGSPDPGTTRDYIGLILGGTSSFAVNHPGVSPNVNFGWLLVSDAAVVPEPGTALLVGLGLGCLSIRRS